MANPKGKALLPAGLQDLLPPEAAFEADVAERLLGCFATHGYERVKPPLAEFEDGLLTGTGAGLADQTFRVMDPVSHRMMALRSDVTPQVARIATARLARSARPLRLSYCGDILRVQGSELRPERQFAQVGYELIGSDSPHADAEVVLLAVEALTAIGFDRLTVDLNAPTLITELLEELMIDEEARGRLRGALDRKDGAEVSSLVGSAAGLFEGLFAATGPARAALKVLEGIDLPAGAKAAADALGAVARLILDAQSKLVLTIDPVERRGFEYQTGVSFTLFGKSVRGELGRGGRYPVGPRGESGTGCTLYMDSLLRALPRQAPGRRVFVPVDAPVDAGPALRRDGWITVAGLEPVSDVAAEARRLGCSHLWASAGAPRPLGKSEGG